MDEKAPAEGHLALATGEPHHVDDWERAAAAVLRKAGRLADDDPDSAVWAALTHTTLDGIEVAPLGTPALTQDLDVTERPVRAGAWDVRAHLSGADAAVLNKAALADLEGGASSLWLQAPDVDLHALLDGVLLDLAPVVLDAELARAQAFVELLTERGTTPAPGTNLAADPVGAAVRRGGSTADSGDLVEVARLAVDAGLLGVVVDATAVHDLGASDVQELGYSVAVGAHYLRVLTSAGLSVDQAAGLVEFRYAATDEQLPTIAKLRAARRLWARVLVLCDAEGHEQRQHAVTSRPMMSAYDPWVNMLRTTVAAFAAGVGGADAVTVLPFDVRLGVSDALGRRIARNTSSLLIEESHVAAVADPAGGAFVVEKLTDDLARAAWAELGRLEGDGGLSGGAVEGLRSRIAETVARRDEEVARRTRPITGLTEFPHLHETLPEREPDPAAPEVRAYGHAFEALRAEPAEGKVFLATMGTVAAHTARATFARNLFAAGGVDVEVAGASEGVDDVLTAYDGQPVVCLAGHDKAYATWGRDLVVALRDAGATWVVVAGKPADLGVDDSCATGVDALAFLTTVREHLSPHQGTRSAPASAGTPKDLG